MDIPWTLRSSAHLNLLLFVIHSGGWTLGNRHVEEMFLLRPVMQNFDFCMISVNYRLAPEQTFASPLNDCWDALIWTEDTSFDADQGDELGTDALFLNRFADLSVWYCLMNVYATLEDWERLQHPNVDSAIAQLFTLAQENEILIEIEASDLRLEIRVVAQMSSDLSIKYLGNLEIICLLAQKLAAKFPGATDVGDSSGDSDFADESGKGIPDEEMREEV
ncbi:MAG: hypothetical protein Q9161_002230 [Pseudevernia consocians]